MSIDAVVNRMDIRGTWGTTLTAAMVRALAIASIHELNDPANPGILLARDGRLSSPAICDIITSASAHLGVPILDLGMIPTEVAYFATIDHSLPLMMVTASHNAPGDNGLKLMRALGVPVGEQTGLQAIAKAAHAILEVDTPSNLAPTPTANPNATNHDHSPAHDTDPTHSPAQHTAPITAIDPELTLNHYRDYVLGHFPRLLRAKHKRRIVVDYANGVASLIAKRVFAKLPVTVIPLNEEIDGTFPAHGVPNPLAPGFLEQLQDAVLANHADLGIAFDGDGDRVVFITEQGQTKPAATIQAFLAAQILQDYPGQPVVYSEISSPLVPHTIEHHRGIPEAAPVGHSAIKAAMRQTNACAALEPSGHYYFSALNNCDSSMMALAYVLQASTNSKKPFSKLIKPLAPWISSPDMNFTHPSIPTAMAAIIAAMGQLFPVALLLDGGCSISVEQDVTIRVRAANSEPLIRVTIDAIDPERIVHYSAMMHDSLVSQGCTFVK